MRADNKRNQINVLAQLNNCSTEKIIAVLGDDYEGKSAEKAKHPEKSKKPRRDWKAIRQERLGGASLEELAKKYDTTVSVINFRIKELEKKLVEEQEEESADIVSSLMGEEDIPATGSRRQILKDAMDEFGVHAQMDFMIEEMAELAMALIKMRRISKKEMPGDKGYDKCRKDILAEVADVRIMLDQMLYIFGYTDHHVAAVENEKLERLRERIAKEAGGY